MNSPVPADVHAIALVMIVRNEARCLARCLDSVRAHVDDMLVLDTGSTDDTAAIAVRHGARVAHFTWVDDFSAARNAALALVDTPWRLVLDADEWLVSGGGVLAALRTSSPDHVGLINVESRTRDERGVVQHAPSWLPRVVPRGVQYTGRIHEQPLSSLPHRRLDVLVGHDGYLPEQFNAKRGRNRTLLLRSLREQPHDAYLHYQLGKEFEAENDFAQALPEYQVAWVAVHPAAPWRHSLLLRLMLSMKKMAQFEAALDLAEREQHRYEQSPDFYFTLGDVLLDAALARPAQAAQWLPLIEQSWLRALAIGERPDMDGTVRGRGSHLAAHNLAAFYESTGRTAEAAVWRQRAQPIA
jgi:glycosyltransferase involved in cell wall biosynthesis